MSEQIYLDAPLVGALEKDFLNRPVDSGYVSSVGPYVAEFERKFADFLNGGTPVAVQSGTAAIHMALLEAGVGPGDEVIVPALTFAATVNPVLYVGARPVIVDVDEATWNISIDAIIANLTPRTKAIIPVHLYGNPCDMMGIKRIAGEKGLKVIEDATESLGAEVGNIATGLCGDFGCFSFNGNKVVTTGGGGIVVSHNLSAIEHIRYLVNQAKDGDGSGCHTEMGFNYRMTNMEAALGLAQLQQLPSFLERKRVFQLLYERGFSGSAAVFQASLQGTVTSSWFTALRFPGLGNIRGLIRSLSARGVPTRRIFMPLGDMPYLKGMSTPCPVAQNIYQTGLCLPGSLRNSHEDIRRVIRILKEVISE